MLRNRAFSCPVAVVFVGFALHTTCTCTAAFTASRAFRIPTSILSLHHAPRSTDEENRDCEEMSDLRASSAHAGRFPILLDRRKTFAIFLSTFGAHSTIVGTVEPANAFFDKTFPDELAETDRQQPVLVLGNSRRLSSQQRASVAAATVEANRSNLQNFNIRNDLGPSLAWGAALWLLLGSRSNPLATPLANLLYDENEAEWLRDRNDGLFGAPPLEFLFILSCVFACLGVLAQFLVLQLSEGDSDVCLQLAGVSVIGGATLELGRIASGEKGETRQENDRSTLLRNEFSEFANKRLISGGNCHRSDIVSAFRRYFSKYRQSDSDEYPLTDLEIEQLLRYWNKFDNRGRAEMTSGGFYYGIQINKAADVFVS